MACGKIQWDRRVVVTGMKEKIDKLALNRLARSILIMIIIIIISTMLIKTVTEAGRIQNPSSLSHHPSVKTIPLCAAAMSSGV